MFRSTAVALRISPFLLFQNDMKKNLGKKGLAPGKLRQTSMRAYKRLNKTEMAALKKRAKAVSNPALDAYNRFQKEYAHRFTNLNNKARNRKVAALWRELKTTGRVTIPAAGAEEKKILRSAVTASKKSAKKHVKKAASKKTSKKKSAKVKKTKKTKKVKKVASKPKKTTKAKKTTKPKTAKKSLKKSLKRSHKKGAGKQATMKRVQKLVNSRMKFLSIKNRKRVAKILVTMV